MLAARQVERLVLVMVLLTMTASYHQGPVEDTGTQGRAVQAVVDLIGFSSDAAVVINW